MMRIVLAASLLLLPSTVVAIDCTLCGESEAPADFLSVIPYLDEGLKTCREVFDIGTFDASLPDCNFLKSLGKFACLCAVGVDPNLGQGCTICPDGSPLPNPNMDVLPGFSCLQLQSNAGRNSDGTCKAYQDAFGPYCGCSNMGAASSTCRICTGNSILPRPFQVSGTSTCLEHEFFSNLNGSCSQVRADHGAACCSVEVPPTTPPTNAPMPVTPAPQQPNPVPTTPPTNPPTSAGTILGSCLLCVDEGKEPAAPDAVITVDGIIQSCSDAFAQGDLMLDDGNCRFTQNLGESLCLCTDEPIPEDPPSPAPIDRGEGCFLCEGPAESPFDPFAQLVLDNGVTSCATAFEVGDLGLTPIQCEFIQNIGREVCLCSEGTAPEPNSCPLCEDGSELPEPEIESLPGLTCADLEVDARRDFPENCPFYQGGIGSYCGCDNPVASASSCRICGAGTVLPAPQRTGEGLADLSCLQHEFLASLTRNCDAAQASYAELCCNGGGGGIIVCFAGTNQVEVLRDDAPVMISMEDLQVGDFVKDGADSYSHVYSFGHYHQEVRSTYLQLFVSMMNAPLEISRNHMVYIAQSGGKKAVPAGSLAVGDELVLKDGETSSAIVKMQTIVRNGAFAPFTESGKLVVSGVLASSFVSMEPESGDVIIFGIKFASHQWLAHVFQTPHRLHSTLFASSSHNESYTDEGLSHWVATPLEAARWWTKQTDFVRAVILLPTLVLLLLLHAVEGVIRRAWLTIVVGALIWISHAVAAKRRKTRKVG